MENDAAPNTGDKEKLHDVLKSFSTVMLITQARDAQKTASDAEVTSRPMQIARLEENCDLWFLTDEDTAKIYEIRAQPVVHVVAQHEQDRFVSLRGVARVVKDRAVIRDLWVEPYKVWFPDGPDTPGIRAIHVQTHEGEYWDNAGTNKIRYIIQAAKAYATGTTPRTERGEQSGKVELH